MEILSNISLKPYNTFGIDVLAEKFAVLHSVDELGAIDSNSSKHILGGGSNVLLTKPISGIVLHNEIKGITLQKEDREHVWLQVNAGEVWHELVMYAINHGWAGIENLALIPGTVGAAPIQNIGAYGVEVKQCIESVTCWNWQEKNFIIYNNSECRFGYRDSIFKHELKDKVFISSVVFKLSKHPTYNISYGAIEQELAQMGITTLSIQAIAQAVINIRSSKLPDPKKIGNAGSFFKNPTIEKRQFELLQKEYPTLPSYAAVNNMVKIPAGWLIEQCGLKGYREGDTGVHEKQALVLVNYGHAQGTDVWQLSTEVLETVQQKFGILLEREVQVW